MTSFVILYTLLSILSFVLVRQLTIMILFSTQWGLVCLFPYSTFSQYISLVCHTNYIYLQIRLYIIIYNIFVIFLYTPLIFLLFGETIIHDPFALYWGYNLVSMPNPTHLSLTLSLRNAKQCTLFHTMHSH